MTPKKRLFSLLLSLLITFSLLSAGLPAASAAADHTPKNIKVKITGVEKDASGKEVLVTEVSWDGDDDIRYFEIYPLLQKAAADDGLYLIPDKDGQTAGTAQDVPDAKKVRTEDGRNKITWRIPLLKEGDKQIETDERGTKALGVMEGDILLVTVAAVTDPSAWQMTEFGEPAEIKVKRPKQTDELLEPNPLKVDGRTVSLKAKKLKSKSQVVKSEKALRVRNAEGVVRYELAQKYAQFTINQGTGDITVKKGTKKGTYKLKVIVTAAGNAKYLPGSKTVTVKIKVK